MFTNNADQINAVASGTKIPCRSCGTLNDPKFDFCITCGTPLEKAKPAETKPAFAAAKTPEQKPAAEKTVKVQYKEPESVFADGLPAWDILPPQEFVRRH